MTAKTNDKPATLAAAMALAFGEIESATKSAPGQVGQQKYKYADLTSVIEAIKPALVANGLYFTQSPRPNPAGAEIETILHHASGEAFSLGSIFVPADRSNAQAFGSALTYARRYALVTAFGVPVEDDDGNAAAAAPPKAEPKPATITDEQRTELMTLLNHLAVPVGDFLAVAKLRDLRQLPAEKFEGAKGWINERAKAKRDAMDDTLEGDQVPY